MIKMVPKQSMHTTNPRIPAIVIRSIAFGLLLMAFFTMMWTGIAESGYAGRDHYGILYLFAAFSLIFIAYAIYLLVIAKQFPAVSVAEMAEGKKMSRWYGIIFGSEGAVIGITCGILSALHAGSFIIPAIALIVGLHFYPMAKIFNRGIDYYLASWTCLIAISAIIMLVQKTTSAANLFAFTGTGVALSTTAYGIYMLFAGRGYTKATDALAE